MGQSQFDPGFAAYGGGSSQSVMHPLVLSMLILIALLVFVLPRKYCMVPLVLGLMLIPTGQNLFFGGFHFYTTRIIVFLGLGRMLLAKLSSDEPLLPGGFGILDKLFVTWALYRSFSVFMQFREWGPDATSVFFPMDGVGRLFSSPVVNPG